MPRRQCAARRTSGGRHHGTVGATPLQPLLSIPADQILAAVLVRFQGMIGASTALAGFQIAELVSLLSTPAPEVKVPRQYAIGCLEFQGGNGNAAVHLHLSDGGTEQVETCYPDADVSDTYVAIGPYPYGAEQTYASRPLPICWRTSRPRWDDRLRGAAPPFGGAAHGHHRTEAPPTNALPPPR